MRASERRNGRALVLTCVGTLLLRVQVATAEVSTLGSPTQEQAMRLNREAVRLVKEGRYDDALPLAERALRIGRHDDVNVESGAGAIHRPGAAGVAGRRHRDGLDAKLPGP